ncbi:hypothetical protein NIES4071_71090 [Calothrix sp. NIES-4071]|nr:hypothetical protein NIES4071_71090 [Calothrix sp. NIES-4071]BAZ61384.1 hypothetical protein NIES4105_71040 [Calothrix sp. NIES-4105]
MRKTYKISLIACLITSTLGCSVLIGENIVQAQRSPRPVELLRSRCVSSGLGSAREENTDIAIGRAVYTSRFFLGPGSRSATLTCRIRPNSSKQPIFQTLNLGFGMRDSDSSSPNAEVRVYLDGRPAEARTVSTSQQNTLSLDVSNVSNVSIEAVCTSGNRYCDRVYFYEASLLRPATQTNVAPSPQSTQQFSVPGQTPVLPPPTTAPSPITPQKY